MRLKGFKRFMRLRPGKRQAWTPIGSHGCGLGVPVGCGIKHVKKMFKRLKGFKRLANGRLERPEEAIDVALG